MLALHVTHVSDTMTPYIIPVIMRTVDVNANSAVDVFGTHTHTVWYCSTHTHTVWN